VPDIDWMKFAIYAVGFGMLITLIGTSIIALHVTASPNLVLACATLIGAMAFSFVQGLLELRPSRDRAFVGAAFELDQNVPLTVRHVRRPNTASQNPSELLLSSLKTIPEVSANAQLASLNVARDEPEATMTRMEIGADFALFSLLHYIRIGHPDWQAKWVLLQAPYSGVSSIEPTASFTQRNCAEFGAAEIRALLSEGGNWFAEASLKEFETNPLCLPPKSTMRLTKNSLSMRNPFLDVTFTITPIGGRFPFFYRFDVVTVYQGLRARHHSMPDYRHWLDRVIADARPWFGVSE
jgi:hypothetical protein